jgi:hypothetical protein
MTKRSDDPADRIPEPIWPSVPIWLMFLAPPVAALAHLQLSFILAHIACATRSKIQIHIATFILLAIVLAAGVAARREWVKASPDNPGETPGFGRRRLMAFFGMIGAVIFGLFILTQWFPNFALGACVRT